MTLGGNGKKGGERREFSQESRNCNKGWLNIVKRRATLYAIFRIG